MLGTNTVVLDAKKENAKSKVEQQSDYLVMPVFQRLKWDFQEFWEIWRFQIFTTGLFLR